LHFLFDRCFQMWSLLQDLQAAVGQFCHK
jgi:hypothetical protein